MEKRVLIFGASGFVGPHLAREFRGHDYQVFGSDLRSSPALLDFVQFHEVDLLDGAAVANLVEAVQPLYIVNLAAISSVGFSWKNPSKTMEINVCGALSILEAVRGLKYKPKVLLIGSSEQYAYSDQPLTEDSPLAASNPYGISKAAQERFAELYCSQFNQDIHLVRAFNHTGPGQSSNFVIPSFVRQVAAIAKSGKPGAMKVGNLDIMRDFSDVRDIVRAYRMILEKDGASRIYNVGSGKTRSLAEILNEIIAMCPQPVTVERDPALFRKDENPVSCCDYRRIRNEIGWEPSIGLKCTLAEMMEWSLSNEAHIYT